VKQHEQLNLVPTNMQYLCLFTKEAKLKFSNLKILFWIPEWDPDGYKVPDLSSCTKLRVLSVGPITSSLVWFRGVLPTSLKCVDLSKTSLVDVPNTLFDLPLAILKLPPTAHTFEQKPNCLSLATQTLLTFVCHPRILNKFIEFPNVKSLDVHSNELQDGLNSVPSVPSLLTLRLSMDVLCLDQILCWKTIESLDIVVIFDIDLSPLTNLLFLKRLRLTVGLLRGSKYLLQLRELRQLTICSDDLRRYRYDLLEKQMCNKSEKELKEDSECDNGFGEWLFGFHTAFCKTVTCALKTGYDLVPKRMKALQMAILLCAPDRLGLCWQVTELLKLFLLPYSRLEPWICDLEACTCALIQVHLYPCTKSV
jgi:hypothetical protein